MSETNDEQSTTLDQRLAAVHESIIAEQRDGASEPASDPESPPPVTSPDSTEGSEAASDASPDETDPVAARRARLEQYEREAAERRQARDTERQKEEKVRALEQELAQLRQRAQQPPPDPTTMGVDEFLRYAREKGISPERVAEYFQADPEDHARAAAESVVDKRIAALQEQIQEQRAIIDEFRGQYMSAQHYAAEQAAASQFFELVRTSREAPRTAAFLEKFGEKNLHDMAVSASASLPEGVGLQAILDHVEDTLDRLSTIYSQQSEASSPATTARATARNTVSNRAAAERSEVREPTGLDDLSFEERVAVLSGAQRIS